MLNFKAFATTLAAAIVISGLGAQAETHTVIFDNRCGFGTPKLIRGKDTLSTGEPYLINGPLYSTIAYLQPELEFCGFDGGRCTMVEITLKNPDPGSPGSGSSTDITLIPPHAFSVTTGFGYYNGCDRQGANCDNAQCETAFHVDTDTHVQVACQTNDVNLVVTFC